MMLCYFQIQKVPGGFTFGFRSDPAAFESRLEKRIEFRKQPVGHSRQGDFIKCIEQKVRPASLCVTGSPVCCTPPPNPILGVGLLMGQLDELNIAFAAQLSLHS